MNRLLMAIFRPDTPTAWIFFVLIVGLFGLALIRAILLYQGRTKQLRQLRDLLSACSPVRSDNDLFEFGRKMADVPIAAEPWQQFRRTLVRRGDAVYSQADFGDFLSSDSLKPDWFLTPRIAGSIPSTLTILGILGTFVSLVQGLTGLDITHTEQLQSGVGQLITSVNTAYVKSIWGVGGSVFFLLLERMLSDKLRWQMETTASQVDSLFEPQSSENWLAQILTEHEQQTHALKTFNTDLSDLVRQSNREVITTLGGFADQVTGVARENSQSQVEAMTEALGQFVLVFRDQMMEAMKTGMGELTDSLTGVAARMETFAQTAQAATENLQAVTGNLAEAQTGLGRAVETVQGTLSSLTETVTVAQKAAEDSRATMEQLVRGQEQTVALVRNLDTVAETVVRTVEAMERCQKEVEHMASELADSVAALDENLSGFTTKFDASLADFSGRVRADIAAAAQGLTGSASTFTDGLVQSFHAFSQRLDVSLDGFTGRVDRSLGNFTGQMDAVHTTLGDTATAFAENVRTDIEQYCAALDTGLSAAASSLRTAVHDIEEVLPTASASLKNQVQGAEDALKRVQTALETLEASAKADGLSLGTSIRDLAGEMNALRSAVHGAAGEIILSAGASGGGAGNPRNAKEGEPYAPAAPATTVR